MRRRLLLERLYRENSAPATSCGSLRPKTDSVRLVKKGARFCCSAGEKSSISPRTQSFSLSVSQSLSQAVSPSPCLCCLSLSLSFSPCLCRPLLQHHQYL